jgi:predicted HicB family RNase H-like nuclease
MNEVVKSKAGRKPLGDRPMDAVMHVRITREEHSALKALAAQRGVSIGSLLRSAVTEMVGSANPPIVIPSVNGAEKPTQTPA